jgi:hypothetical protein
MPPEQAVCLPQRRRKLDTQAVFDGVQRGVAAVVALYQRR